MGVFVSQYFYLFSPNKVAIYGVFLFLFFLLISPVNLTVEFNYEAFFYILFCYILFFLGSFLANFGIKMWPKRNYRLKVLLYQIWMMAACIAFVGVLLRIYSRFVLRGYDISLSAMSNREILELAGSSVTSIPAAVLYPFSYIPIFIWLAMPKARRTYFGLFVSLSFFSYPIIDSMLVHSRNIILISFMMLGFFVFLFSRHRFYFKQWFLIFSSILICISIFLLVFLYFFESRLESMHLNVMYSIHNSVYAFTAQPNSWVVDLISLGGFSGSLAFLYLNLSQYYISGVFEFFYMYEYLQGYEVINSWGGNMFFPVYKLYLYFSSSADDPLKYIYEIQPRTGIYLSFFGPLYVDFGWFGLIFMFVFGWGAQKIYLSVKNLNILLIPLYFYVLLIVLFFPVLNFIQSAQGLYVISAFSLFYILARHFFTYKLISDRGREG